MIGYEFIRNSLFIILFVLANKKGMTGFDIEKILIRAMRSAKLSLNSLERLSVKNLSKRAVVSPFFGANDFAFSYALA